MGKCLLKTMKIVPLSQNNDRSFIETAAILNERRTKTF